MSSNPAVRRYQIRVLGLGVAYAVTLVGAELLFQQHRVGGGMAYVVAALPALPIIGIFVAIWRYLVEERDEYLRMLMVRQSLIASGLTLSIVTVWGFLESFGLVVHLDAYFVAVVWFAGLGAGGCINRLRP